MADTVTFILVAMGVDLYKNASWKTLVILSHRTWWIWIFIYKVCVDLVINLSSLALLLCSTCAWCVYLVTGLTPHPLSLFAGLLLYSPASRSLNNVLWICNVDIPLIWNNLRNSSLHLSRTFAMCILHIILCINHKDSKYWTKATNRCWIRATN